MSQDMKNFYELTVIDINNQLEVEIELIEHESPEFQFTVNGLPVVSSMRFYFCLLDSLCFSCSVTRGAIEIANITVNGREIMPLYQHVATPATNWITAEWHLTVPSPFYAWYHQVTGQGWIA